MTPLVYAGAIVRTADERILCQLRDDTPGIIYPSTWNCCPGGQVETGETPSQAVLRELSEEFEISVANLTPLLSHTETNGAHRGVYHAFMADLATPLCEVKCNEGVRTGFFTPQQAIDFPQHPVSLLFLRTFIKLTAKQ